MIYDKLKLKKQIESLFWGHNSSDRLDFAATFQTAAVEHFNARVIFVEENKTHTDVQIIWSEESHSKQLRPIIAAINCDCPLLIGSMMDYLARKYIAVGCIHYGVLSHLDCVSRPYSLIMAKLEGDIDQAKSVALVAQLMEHFGDIQKMTSDYHPMRQHISRFSKSLREGKIRLLKTEFREQVSLSAILDWFIEGNLIVLGLVCSKINSAGKLTTITQLGLNEYVQNSIDSATFRNAKGFCASQIGLRNRHYRDGLVQHYSFTYECKKEIQNFTIAAIPSSSFRRTSTYRIPLIRDRFQAILNEFRISQDSHEYRTTMKLVESYPAEDLIRFDQSELRVLVKKFMLMQKSPIPYFHFRRESKNSVMFGLILRKELVRDNCLEDCDRVIQNKLHAQWVDTTRNIIDERFTLVLWKVLLSDANYSASRKTIADLEKTLLMAFRNWRTDVRKIVEKSEETINSQVVFKIFPKIFGSPYIEQHVPRDAVRDLDYAAETLEQSRVRARIDISEGYIWKIKIFSAVNPVSLSKSVRALEHCGFNVISENPYSWVMSDNKILWIHCFEVESSIDIGKNIIEHKLKIPALIEAVLENSVLDDHFNKLCILAYLDWRQIHLLRALSAYLKQLGDVQTLASIRRFFLTYPQFAKATVDCFEARFNEKETCIKSFSRELLNSTHTVSDEKIMTRVWALVQTVLRTNYFDLNLKQDDGRDLVLKIDTSILLQHTVIRPVCEIFVYAAEFEGVHLRMALTARGGLRWSDRLDDYRTEVLELAKAQRVKNAMTVPSGAKGGFVFHNDLRRAVEVKEIYKRFVKGLLQAIDNPSQTTEKESIVYDGDDPYLVVAADKGTASFSDLANELAQAQGFWLNDAFASGGKHGFDHKKLGITAKGAWEATKHHFEALGRNPESEEFTAVGIGDMSGDVFGNGMLCSRQIKLVAAFNHQHIFLDPRPNPFLSHEERSRLFELPGSTWNDYSVDLISDGGGVFSREEKRLAVSAEVVRMLCLTKNEITPQELINSILQAKVDLIWNGGIGTYVKASWEINNDIADRANASVRINADQINALVVIEGGNLGVTHFGRVEAAMNGIGINGDFIDNVSGVDCSDHEVNIKILLAELTSLNVIESHKRNRLLKSVEDDVVSRVLMNNRRQVVGLSISVEELTEHRNRFADILHILKNEMAINLQEEQLPTQAEIDSRKTRSISRPEIARLIAIGKLWMKKKVLSGDPRNLINYEELIAQEFPDRIVSLAKQHLVNTMLADEIATCIVVNRIVDILGMNSILRISELGNPCDFLNAAEIVMSLQPGIYNWDSIFSEFSDTIYSEEIKQRAHTRKQLISAINSFLSIVDMNRIRNEKNYKTMLSDSWRALVNNTPSAQFPERNTPQIQNIFGMWLVELPLAVVIASKQWKTSDIKGIQVRVSGLIHYDILQQFMSTLRNAWKPDESPAINMLEKGINSKILRIIERHVDLDKELDDGEKPESNLLSQWNLLLDKAINQNKPTLAKLVSLDQSIQAI